MALDGMLIWTTQPTKRECRQLKFGKRSFHCYRKKFVYLLRAGCDDKCLFRWADICHPGVTSDYLAWMTSDIGRKLSSGEDGIVIPGYTIVSDNAFVEYETMSVPIPGKFLSDCHDGYNFYLSQVRITIERAFGTLVDRFGILRRPMSMSIRKVPAIVTCLMRLHNFYIDNEGRHCSKPMLEDERTIRRLAGFCKDRVTLAVSTDSNGSPSALVGSGHHFHEVPCILRRDVRSGSKITPMQKMIRKCEDLDLKQPNF